MKLLKCFGQLLGVLFCFFVCGLLGYSLGPENHFNTPEILTWYSMNRESKTLSNLQDKVQGPKTNASSKCFVNGEESHYWPLRARPVVIESADECGVTYSTGQTTGPGNRLTFSSMARVSLCERKGEEDHCKGTNWKSIKPKTEALILYCEECQVLLVLITQK